jgi:hypothetical protein
MSLIAIAGHPFRRGCTPDLYQWANSPELRVFETRLTALIKREAHFLAPADKSQPLKKKGDAQPTKSGFLTKKGKMFKQWKKYWFVLSDGYMSYYRTAQATTPAGVIDLQDVISVDEWVDPKPEKEKSKKKEESCFSVITVQRTLLFQAASNEERNEWVNLIRRHSVLHNKVPKPNVKSTNTLEGVLTSECLLHLRESLTQANTAESGVSVSTSSSSFTLHLHPPYKQRSPSSCDDTTNGTDFQRTDSGPNANSVSVRHFVQICGAESVLVTFDSQCQLRAGVNILRLWRNVTCTDLIASFTGQGIAAFPPTLVETNRFWLTLDVGDPHAPEYGVQIHVHPLRTYVSDATLLTKCSFDVGFLLVDWFLSVNPVWVRPFYCKEVFNLLILHLENCVSNLERRVKLITTLKRLLQHWDEFPKESKPNLTKLTPWREELFELYDTECRTGGEHSLYFQRLFELMVQVHKLTTDTDNSLGLTVDAVFVDKEKEKKTRSSAGERDRERVKKKRNSLEEFDEGATDTTPSLTSVSTEKKEKDDVKEKRKTLRTDSNEQAQSNKKKKRKAKKRRLDPSWFYAALNTLRVMERVSKGDEFPAEFCKEAFLEANKQIIVEESPHPYVDIVRVLHFSTDVIVIRLRATLCS